jgi:hypothetical protein
MKESTVLTGYVFGSILTLGGLAMVIFVDKAAVMSSGVSDAFGVPVWIMGALVLLFGATVLVRSFRLQRQK